MRTRVGLSSRIEDPQRIRCEFEIREDVSGRLMSAGCGRAGCVDFTTFAPRDVPEEAIRLFEGLPDLAERQAHGEVDVRWT